MPSVLPYNALDIGELRVVLVVLLVLRAVDRRVERSFHVHKYIRLVGSKQYQVPDVITDCLDHG